MTRVRVDRRGKRGLTPALAPAKLALMAHAFMTIAHRGASGARPENTLAAFRHALELGIRHLECDVRLSRDGQIVVMHDATVDRTTDGRGRVSDLTLAELRALDAGGRFAPAWAGERIPLLDELLAIVPADARIVVEIKDDDRFPRLTDATVDALRGWDPDGRRVGISAFEVPTLRRVHGLWPAVELSALLREAADPMAGAATGATILCPRASDIDAALVERLHAAGYVVRAWGLKGRDEAEMKRLVACGVDGMTTDYPDVLAALYRGAANPRI
jgi:glycerophosphoryl diester phosphodiesterase